MNHPPHYGQHPTGIECIEIVEHFGFNLGNAIKYLWRAGLKEGADEIQDLEKAEWYVRREINRRLAPLHVVRTNSSHSDVAGNLPRHVPYDPGPSVSD